MCPALSNRVMFGDMASYNRDTVSVPQITPQNKYLSIPLFASTGALWGRYCCPKFCAAQYRRNTGGCRSSTCSCPFVRHHTNITKKSYWGIFKPTLLLRGQSNEYLLTVTYYKIKWILPYVFTPPFEPAKIVTFFSEGGFDSWTLRPDRHNSANSRHCWSN